MKSDNSSRKSYLYGPYEGYELRCQRRLKTDLGVNASAADAILHLRNQVLELQSRLRQLEAELTAQSASQQLRLARYHETYYEATWVELEIQE